MLYDWWRNSLTYMSISNLESFEKDSCCVHWWTVRLLESERDGKAAEAPTYVWNTFNTHQNLLYHRRKRWNNGINNPSKTIRNLPQNPQLEYGSRWPTCMLTAKLTRPFQKYGQSFS
jgi:hypothetical protein